MGSGAVKITPGRGQRLSKVTKPGFSLSDFVPRYLMNGLSNLNETYEEYSLAPTDDLIGF